MDWKDIYKSKVVSAAEALSHIQSGDMIVPGHAAAEPKYLMQQLCDLRGQALEKRCV